MLIIIHSQVITEVTLTFLNTKARCLQNICTDMVCGVLDMKVLLRLLLE